VRRSAFVLTVIAAVLCVPSARAAEEGLTRELGTVVVTGRRPTSLPTQIPTTIEGITGEDVTVTINATDAEDALKYFPSLLVRKRYIGDYDHAVLATAVGTGNSAFTRLCGRHSARICSAIRASRRVGGS
jgi:iron complex outermembrane receptor protein